jgi:hypothetical protein
MSPDALVQNAAISTAGQLWAAGNNTVGFNSNNTLFVAPGASIRSTGSATTAESLDVIGAGNTVTNHGLIFGLNSAAIWFEDKTVGTPNTVDNYGTIQKSDDAVVTSCLREFFLPYGPFRDNSVLARALSCIKTSYQSVRVENSVERREDGFTSIRKGAYALARSAQRDRTHAWCIQETFVAVNFENRKQVGRFAREGEMSGGSQGNNNAARQNFDVSALHIQQVGCKSLRFIVRIRIKIKPRH